jgi:predicted Zn-dependent protease
MMQTTILIQPILFKPDKDIIIALERILSEQFNTSSIVTASQIKEVPDGLFNEQRKQWKSNGILQWLSDKYKPYSNSRKILAMCDFDAYSGQMNFVFGIYVKIISGIKTNKPR